MAGGSSNPVPAGRVSNDAPATAEVQIRPSSLTITLNAAGLDLERDDVMFTRYALRIRRRESSVESCWVIPLPVLVEPERFRAILSNGVLDVVVERAREASS